MEILKGILVVIHILGAAAIIGPYLQQLRAKEQFELRWLHIGAGMQVVTGILLVGMAYALGNGGDINNVKITFKLLFALTALLGVLMISKAKPGKKHIWLHVAGIAAIVNVVVAVLWSYVFPS